MSFETSITPQPMVEITNSAAPPAGAEQGLGLRDLWRVVSRRRKLLLAITVASLALGIVYVAVTPRLYRAEAQLEILKQDAAAGLSDPAQASASMAADALDFNLAVQTYVDVIRSRQLALRVINELHLDQEEAYKLRGSNENPSLPLAQTPRRMDHVVSVFNKRLNVSSVSGTRLVSVTFVDANPDRAAQVVNQLIADFIDHNFQVRFQASAQATSFLAGELGRMKEQVDNSEAVAVRLQQDSGIFGVNETNNATNAKLEQLNAQLTIAQQNLALRKSIYNLALTRNPEVLAGMIGAQGTGANTANAPLQLLRQQQADAAASYAELNAHYGPQYPKVVQAAEKLASVQTSISSEINRLVGQATAEYRVAQDTNNAAEQAMDRQKVIAGKMNHDAIVYTSAKHEADTSRDLYEKLQQRLKEAGVLAGMRSSNLNLLDTAVAPAKPSQPKALIAMLISLFAGLFVGLVAIFTIDAVDDRIRSPQRMEDATGLPLLALIPPASKALTRPAIDLLRHSTEGENWLYETTARIPRSSLAEAFRGLRNALIAASRSRRTQIIAITSTSESEGKSFTTFNLASAFAQSGRSVLVVDGDLHKNALSVALGFGDAAGFDGSIEDNNWQKYVKTYREVPGLFILPAGRQQHHPGDVVAFSMPDLLRKLRATFDIILIDTPSIIAVADTVALSSSVDAVVLVARSGVTAEHTLLRTLSILRRGGARVIGTVLNSIDFESPDFIHYWGKPTSGYAAGESDMLAPNPQVIRQPRGVLSAHTLVGICLMSVPLLGQGTTEPLSTAKPGVAQSAEPRTPKVKQVFLGSDPSMSPESAQQAPAPVDKARTVLPMPGAIPEAQQQTVLGTGDLIHVTVYDAPELAQDARISSAGQVHLTLLGDFHAAGLQPDELATRLEAVFREKNLIRQPNVTVELKEFTTQGVTVEGEVVRPGIYPVYTARSVVDVLALASGRTPQADIHVNIRRKSTGKLERVTLRQSDEGKSESSDIRIFPGDTVIVPRAGYAYVLGNVARPGGYLMHDDGGMTVLQAIAEAQGTTKLASLDHVLLLRKGNDGSVTIPISLKQMQKGNHPDQRLLAGDILYVPTSGMKNFGQNSAAILASVSGAALYAVAR